MNSFKYTYKIRLSMQNVILLKQVRVGAQISRIVYYKARQAHTAAQIC